ncbi:MAG: SPFH domain-containing protein [bacterium]|nr:SPFH domain-containing protein [bacterium]MDE0376880.1 SPFH domain-containing protein [bacterium]
MFIAILAIVLAVVGVVLLTIWLRTRKRASKETDSYRQRDLAGTAVFIGVIAAVAGTAAVGLAIASLVTIIPANHAGVEVLFGKPTRVFGEGLNIKNPLASVVEMPGLQQESTYSNTVNEGERGGPDAVVAQTTDNLDVDVDASVLWSLNLEGTGPVDTYREYRTIEQVRAVLLRPISRDAIRVCIARFNFEEARTIGREQIGDCSAQAIAAAVFPFVIVRDVQIREMSASPEVMAAIDRKAAAEQAAREAEFRRDQAAIDAETARIAAEGVANAEIERARGIAEANRLVDESLTPTLLEYRKVEFLSQSNNTVWVLGSDDSPELVIPVGGPIAPDEEE